LGEISYCGKSGALIAERFLTAARDVQNDMAGSTPRQISLNDALGFLRTLWNLRAVPPDEREEVYSRMPEHAVGFLREKVEESGMTLGNVLIREFLLLKADRVGEERLLVLLENL
jgi:hypothetical protein